MPAPLLTALGLAAAAGVHFAIGRAARRLPRWLARRRGETPGPDVRYGRAFAVVSLAVRTALWLGALWLVSQQHEPLLQARDASLRLLARALHAPLFSLNERSYSALDLVALPALLAALWIGIGFAVRSIRSHVFEAAGVESGLQETLAILLRYGLTFIGALVLLQGFGVDVRALAIAASVLGVGIGFGLQNIANNFVSGLLINLERPVRPGDYVNVGSFEGSVVRVGGRSTTVRTIDGVLILIPNSKFLETEVVNWSLGDPRSRIHVSVGVAYGSDPARVRRALLEVARAHPEVEADPRPQVQLAGFGESSLDFELLVWTRDARNRNRLASDLNFRVVESLGRCGITIPFPQRDLHLRSPGLEEAARAWAHRLAPELASTDPGAARIAPTAPGATEADEPDRERGLDDWSDAEVVAAAELLRSSGEVAIRERRHLLRVFPDAFVGREAVDWLVQRFGLNRDEAVALGQRWVEQGVVRHVLDEHRFRDGHFYYRLEPTRAAGRV